MQFLVIAHDDADAAGALRRRGGRARHFDDVREIGEDGQLVAGGALLDDAGQMVGAAMIGRFPKPYRA